MLSHVFLVTFSEMAPKVFINDSVYKVFRIGISDVAKYLFGNGFLGIWGALFGQNVPLGQ